MVADNYRSYRKKLFLIFVLVYIAFGYSIHNTIFLKEIGYRNYSVIPTSGHIGNMSDMTGFASLIKRSHSLTTGDLFTNEYRGIRGISPNLSILVMKLFSNLFGGMKNVFILLNILMPIIYILLIFFFFTRIIKMNYFISLLAGVSVLTLTDIINSLFNLHFHNIIGSFFHYARGKYQFSYFGRLPHIELSFIFILLFFILFVMAIERKNKIYTVLAGISYGLLFYVYFYYWVYATVFIGIFFTVLFFGKHRECALITFYVFLLGLTVGLYYIILYFNIRSLPMYENYILKIGTVFFRNIEKKSIFETILIVGTIIGIKRGKLNIFDYLIISFLSTISVVMNIQVFTGFTIEPEHFRITVWTPFLILFSIYYIGSSVKTKHFNSVIMILLIILPLLPIISNIRFANQNIRCYSKLNDIEKICYYVAKNDSGKIVATDDVLVNSALSYKTDNPLFLSNGFYNYLTPDEILKRESIILKIRGENDSYLDSLLIKASINADCKGLLGEYSEKAWMFYFLHTYYFDYRINGFYITPDLLNKAHEIYKNAFIDDEGFDVLITKDTIAVSYKHYFKKVKTYGEYSIYERLSSLINP